MSYGHYPQQRYPQHGGGGYGNMYHQPQQHHHDPYRAWYAARLAELTFNSRPIIQNLSMEAMRQRDESNWPAMQAITEEIEAAVLRVRLFCLLSRVFVVVFCYREKKKRKHNTWLLLRVRVCVQCPCLFWWQNN